MFLGHFSSFCFWMKDLAVFDLEFGFYVKFPPQSRILRSGIENLASKTPIKFLVLFLYWFMGLDSGTSLFMSIYLPYLLISMMFVSMSQDFPVFLGFSYMFIRCSYIFRWSSDMFFDFLILMFFFNFLLIFSYVPFMICSLISSCAPLML